MGPCTQQGACLLGRSAWQGLPQAPDAACQALHSTPWKSGGRSYQGRLGPKRLCAPTEAPCRQGLHYTNSRGGLQQWQSEATSPLQGLLRKVRSRGCSAGGSHRLWWGLRLPSSPTSQTLAVGRRAALCPSQHKPLPGLGGSQSTRCNSSSSRSPPPAPRPRPPRPQEPSGGLARGSAAPGAPRGPDAPCRRCCGAAAGPGWG